MIEEVCENFDATEYEFYHIVLWLIENDVEFRYPFHKYHQKDKMVPVPSQETDVEWEHELWFRTPEDHMAFKLRWL